MDEVKRIVHVRSSVIEPCQVCRDQMTKLSGDASDYLVKAVNHYIQQHGYQLLHVGQETDRTSEGALWQMTVAVLGK